MAISSITIMSTDGERAVIPAYKIPDILSCADDIWVKTANDTHIVVVRAAFRKIGGLLQDMATACDPVPDEIGRIVLHATQARPEHVRAIVNHALEGTPYHCFRHVADAAKRFTHSMSSVPVAAVAGDELRAVCRVVGISDDVVQAVTDDDRVARSLDNQELFATAETARYLAAEAFLASCCRTVAERISGMSTEQMMRFFGVNDSEGMPKEVWRQNGWETWS